MPVWSSGFPYFLQFKPEFCIKEFIIWATVSSWSCFADCIELLHLLLKGYNQSDFSIDHLVMFIYRVISHVAEKVFAMTSALSWQNSLSFFPTSFCTPRPNLPVTIGIFWLPTFAFQSPLMKMNFSFFLLFFFFGVSTRISCQASWNHSTLAPSVLLFGA